jgi:hypothetical protein
MKNSNLKSAFAAGHQAFGNTAMAGFSVAAAVVLAHGSMETLAKIMGTTVAVLQEKGLFRDLENMIKDGHADNAAIELWYKGKGVAAKYHERLVREHRVPKDPHKEWQMFRDDFVKAHGMAHGVEVAVDRPQHYYETVKDTHGHAPTHHFTPHHGHHPHGNAPTAHYALGGPTPTSELTG